MKKLFSIAAVLVIAVQCFATGPTPLNSPQSGVAVFSAGNSTGLYISNNFAPNFTAVPVISAFASNTNTLVSALTVTTSNLVITVTNAPNGTTNVSVAWTATFPQQLIQYGSVVALSPLNTNITFPQAYAYPPTVTLSGSTSNSVPVTISATGFTANNGQSNTVNWISVGPAAAPGYQTVTH